jgi:hypothetical protein
MPRKNDEFRMHLYLIQKLMNKHNKILIYALPGEGKTRIMMSLMKKFANSEWAFYDLGEHPVESDKYVYALISPDQAFIPKYDIIYCIQYSREYKEEVTGVSFPDNLWRPMAEYARRAEWDKFGKANLIGRKVNSITNLRKILNGE